MFSHFLRGAFFMFLCYLLQGCASNKDVLYLQNLNSFEDNQIAFKELKFQKSDILSIVVATPDQKSAVPFNLPAVTTLEERAAATSVVQTYLIDHKGAINFPVLGKIDVAGKTNTQLTRELQHMLSRYIKNPIVTVRLTNFKVAVLGEVKKPGHFTIQNDRVNVFQALSMAGDMTIYGQRKEATLLREDSNGKKSYHPIDFTSKDLLNSPYYYMQQNDVLIVPPNKAQVQSSAFNRNTPVFISIAGVIITVISIFAR